MAKNKEPKALKKGKASFNLIGRVKRTDKSFNLNNTYDSGWTDNSMYIGVDCGNGNVVYSEMRSGFFPDNESTIRAYSKDDKDENGKSKSVEIAWEDRLDESILDTVADTSLITVGVEKDVHGKTVYKKFLQAYDAVEYLDEYLEDNVVVNVKGNLGYSEYDGNVSVKKDITSIVLSKVEDENDFKATFSQTILIEPKCIGKTLEEKGTIELDAYVVDYVGKPKVDGKKVEVKKNVVFPKTFEIEINENHINVEIDDKLLKTKETVLCSDSSGGWRSKIKEIKPISSDFQVEADELINRIEELKNNAQIWQATGGTHVAGIVYKNNFIVKEDVSRHVAVDKVIGYGILHNYDLSNSYVIYSGRMPADMVIKIVRAGIPVLASNAAPAYSGCETAKKGNVTLVGFLRGQRFNVYNNKNRIIF